MTAASVTRPTIIAPSILACDFTRLADEVKAVEGAGADWLHLDVMDGHFVPNISFGPVIVSAVKRVAHRPIDVQLMIEHPERYAAAFIEAGANHLTVHVEAAGLKDEAAMRAFLRSLRRQGIKAGLSLRPQTPMDALRPYLAEIDLLLIMTVEPGFGGQAFLPDTVEKVRTARRWFDGDVEVDGGITAQTAALARAAGANALVAGTYVFRHPDYRAAIASLKG